MWAVITSPNHAINRVVGNYVLEHIAERADRQVAFVAAPEPCSLRWILWKPKFFAAA